MKIREFAIHQYGPLSESGTIRLADFNLFWGENEDGKTLTMDALIRLLMGKGHRVVPGLDRVAENPDGYVILSDDDGSEYKLPEQGTIQELLYLNPSEFHSLFFIRNSDLSIAMESEFYGNVTEKLTGLRTTQINRITERIKSLGHFTDGLETVNHRTSQYLKRRLDLAAKLQTDCITIAQEAEAQGLDRLEEELIALQKRSQQLERSTNEIDQARLRQKYNLANEHLTNISNYNNSKLELADFTDEEYSQWLHLEESIMEKTAEKEHLLAQKQTYMNELEEERRLVENIQSEYSRAFHEREKINDQIRPLLAQYDVQAETIDTLQTQRFTSQIALAVMMILSFVLLAILIATSSPKVFVACGISGIITLGLSIVHYYRYKKPADEFDALAEQILHEAQSTGLPGNNASEIHEQIRLIDETVQKHHQRTAASEGRIEFLKNSISAIQDDRIVEIERRLESANDAIQRIAESHDVDTSKTYRTQLEIKKQLEQQIKDSVTTLNHIFDTSSDSGEISDLMEVWQQKLAELERYEDTAQDQEFNEAKLDNLRQELRDTDDRVDIIRKRMRDFREKLADLERRAREVIVEEDEFIACRNLQDVLQLQERLQVFMDSIQNQQRIARTALQIFEELDLEEKQKVSALFGKDSKISRLYEEVTGGLYSEIHYDPEQNGILVRRNDGKKLPPQWLSGGAYDQLYFIIRIVLSEKLLRGKKGIFIFDDPFLKSDLGRLKRQMDLLLEIAQSGWQIIYFSAKEEVRDTLKSFITAERVLELSVPEVQFKGVFK